ncbi:MAG: sugar ABC transporter permease [Chloroflexi bacterium]|nr:sugar ABC transporter permease [Chloroflexota bacterium]
MPYLLVTPALVSLASVALFPLLYSLRLSFFEWSIARPAAPAFVGLQNYGAAFQDERLLASLKITFILASAALLCEILAAFPLALLLNADVKGMRFISTALISPLVLAPVGVGVLWRIMYTPEFSPLNWLIAQVGLGAGPRWVSDRNVVLAAVVAVDVWHYAPFVMLVLLAGLKSLPHDPFEAAAMDGAGPLQAFRYITLPLLTPVILVVMIFRTIGLINAFDTVFVLTGGGPGGLTEIVSVYVFKTGFKFFDMGYASALSYILVAIAAVLSMIYVLLLSREIDM